MKRGENILNRKKKRLSIAKICVLYCVTFNVIDMITIGFSIFRLVAVVLGTVAFICFTIEGKRMEK